MKVFAHMGGLDEIASVFLPALILFVVYRIVRGRSKPSDPEDPGTRDGDTAQPTSPR